MKPTVSYLSLAVLAGRARGDRALAASPCNTEGACSSGSSSDSYSICASGYWQDMPSNGYLCTSGSLVPNQISSALGPNITSPRNGPATTQITLGDSSSNINGSESTPEGGVANQCAKYYQAPAKGPGRKSYTISGKMASVYDANPSSHFRCDDVAYPSDGMYVAFWTAFDQNLADSGQSQPAPGNCGAHMEFTNPVNNKTARAVVLDRCASCVGVGNVLHDPTTSDCLVNGATVDFSWNLWNFLFDNSPGDVYDILYDGCPLAGAVKTANMSQPCSRPWDKDEVTKRSELTGV